MDGRVDGFVDGRHVPFPDATLDRCVVVECVVVLCCVLARRPPTTMRNETLFRGGGGLRREREEAPVFGLLCFLFVATTPGCCSPKDFLEYLRDGEKPASLPTEYHTTQYQECTKCKYH